MTNGEYQWAAVGGLNLAYVTAELEKFTNPDHTNAGKKENEATLQAASSNSSEMKNIDQTEDDGISSTPIDKANENVPVSESE